VPAPSQAQAAEAERVARASHARAFPADGSRRDVVYWAPWVRAWFRRGVQTAEQCGRELAALPAWWREKLELIASDFGGKRTTGGRHILMYGALIYWYARQGQRVISGLSQAAWASLSVGPREKHYSLSTLFHPLHDAARELADKRGPKGGSWGAGSNCGLVRALEREGLVEVLQPDGRCHLPAWLVGRTGWTFGQFIVREHVDEPDDLPDRAVTHAQTIEACGVRIPGPS
jgi:hypothetical protein